jgi:hypothetical protein
VPRIPSFKELINQHTLFGRIEAQRNFERMRKIQAEYEAASPKRQEYLEFFYGRHGA